MTIYLATFFPTFSPACLKEIGPFINEEKFQAERSAWFVHLGLRNITFATPGIVVPLGFQPCPMNKMTDLDVILRSPTTYQ